MPVRGCRPTTGRVAGGSIESSCAKPESAGALREGRRVGVHDTRIHADIGATPARSHGARHDERTRAKPRACPAHAHAVRRRRRCHGHAQRNSGGRLPRSTRAAVIGTDGLGARQRMRLGQRLAALARPRVGQRARDPRRRLLALRPALPRPPRSGAPDAPARSARLVRRNAVSMGLDSLTVRTPRYRHSADLGGCWWFLSLMGPQRNAAGAPPPQTPGGRVDIRGSYGICSRACRST